MKKLFGVFFVNSALLFAGFGNLGIVKDLSSPETDFSFVFEQVDKKIISFGYNNIFHSGPQQLFISKYEQNGSLEEKIIKGEKVFSSLFPVAKQPDGKIILVGRLEKNSPTKTFVLVARIFLDGTLDTTFGDKGIVTDEIEASSAYSTASGFALLSNGKMILSGDTQNYPVMKNFLLKLDSNGMRDTTFGNKGVVLHPWQDAWTSYLLNYKEKYLYLGGTNYKKGRSSIVYRMTLDGEFDTTFGTKGALVAPSYCDTYSYLTGFSITSEDKILVNCLCYDKTFSPYFAFQTNLDGKLDTAFATSGVLDISGSTPVKTWLSSLLSAQPNGDIFAAFKLGDPLKIILKKFSKEGKNQTLFGKDGTLELDFSPHETGKVSNLVFLQSGKIILPVTGYSYRPGTGEILSTTAMMARITSDGKLDK
jgi:uncharacterized delta-60 repeat protein